MTMTLSSRQRAARHWSRVLPDVTREEHWPTDVAPAPTEDGRETDRLVEERALDSEAAARLLAVTRGDAVLVHTVLTATLAVCFAGRSGRRDIWLDVPPVVPGAAGFEAPEGSAVPMPVLPVRVVVAPDGTGAQLLAETRQALLDGYAAQYVDPATAAEGADQGAGGWLLTHDELHHPVRRDSRFAGVLRIGAGPEPVLTVTGDAGRYSSASLRRLADQAVDVLTALATNPDQPLSRIPRWRPADLRAAEAAATGPSADPTEPVEHLFGPADSDRPAVVAEDGTLTHTELDRRSRAVARGLSRRLSPGPDGRMPVVGLLTGSSMATAVGAYAALRAGLPYVVVPPGHVEDWALLRERGVALVVTAGRAPDVPSDIGAATLDELAETSGADPEPVAPENPAYLIFTSGSTGAAKAVVVTRANLAASNHARRLVYGTEPPDFLLLSPLHFDSSVAGLFWTLSCGGTLHIAPEDTLGDPARLAGYIARHGVTATLGLPRVLDGIACASVGGELRTLRVVVGAGETFPAGLAVHLREAAPEARVVNEYGPSEATVWATWHDVTGDETDVPIGRPVPGMRVHVVDGWGAPVPPGVPGQIAVGGPQVCLGYAGNAELTAARFVPDRLGGADGDRLYLTGDEGWVDPDGALHFVGRIDDEVKIRGIRVQLADVAEAFRQHPGVNDTEALLADGGLVVFLAGDRTLDGEAVLADVRPVLAVHAVPSRVVVLPEIPRLSNGKRDRRRLLELAERPAPVADDSTAPEDDLERHVVALFREVLGAADVGMTDDFFRAGGDSIKAALLTAQLSRELSTYIYVVALLDNPTPASLAAFLRQEYGQALADSAVQTGGTTASDCGGGAAAEESGGSLADQESGERLRRLLADSHDHGSAPTPASKLSGPVFVLGPPRSGTTLLRIILSGHPALFAPPELELLQFGTLTERDEELSGRYSFNREGLVRAVMALADLSAPEAEALLSRMAEEGGTVVDAYRWLTEHADGRTLVDKTTAYALDLATLSRAEELFDQPRYVHLIRHPQACVSSFLEARLDQTYLRVDHGYPAEQAAELVWRLAHEHTSAFLDGIDPRRVLRVHFEELVADPERVGRRVCEFLGIPFTERMLDVYDDRQQRMTDGLRPGGRMLGDIKFHEHRTIDRSAADRWRDAGARPLHERTTAVARELGYGPGGLIVDTGLTSQQRFVWFLEFMRPGTAMYHIPVLLSGESTVDEAALRRAVRTVARRHHAFRSVVTAPEGEPLMRFVPDLAPLVEVEEVAADAQRERAEELAVEPFDLEQESLMRVHLLRDGDRFTLLILVHHLVADARSVGIIVGDLLDAYEHWRAGRPPLLAAVARQASDAGAEETELDAAAAEAVTARVRRRLSGATWPLNLPPVRTGDDAASARAVAVRRGVEPAVGEAVRRYAADHGCSVYRVLLVAFGLTVAELTGARDFLVGAPVLRRGPYDDRTVGLFVNTALVRLDLTAPGSFDDLVRRSESAVRDAIADAELPYEEIVAALADLTGGGESLLQAAFSVQSLDLPLDRGPSLRLRREIMTPQYAKFDIGVSVTDEDGRFTIAAEFNAARFDDASAGRFVTDFVETTRHLVRVPATDREEA
ncbi:MULTISPECIES: AMP-binding protein [unclassified Micromonospora]|uniref:AMP-binding protein n=1 Tax=unclassified Micromonospora TaxID=2617518 RepID=UPI001C219E48|nr:MULTISPECIES: AMP-binding protein [unclassified Micromonospora]MBU8858617.1 AMP-binding protein [Micromonospora sp. WMMB482]MDM4784261.1 AMP-binding protein [Micromonospora sp. b486]